MNRPIRCLYADQPARRPHCQLAATVTLGGTPLCPSCQGARSTLGKAEPPRPLAPTTGLDILDWITEADQRTRAAQDHLAAAVHRARRDGHTWTAIAERLHITRQAAQQRVREAATN